MGLSSLPQEPSKAGYQKVFDLVGDNGELILIQRAPPWEEFLPDGVISAETVELTREEKRLADENGLEIFAAVDPLDPADRGRLASPPEDPDGRSLADAGFADPRIRSAFIAYAQYLALNLKPRYMALGMEVDLYEAARPDDFDNFVDLYFEAYDAVKDISPETLVFPTFQMEAIQNLLSPSDQDLARWHLVLRFEPKVDILAVTTYPSFVFATPGDIPPNYYDKLRRFSDVPIAIAAMGYSSGQGRDGINEGTEEEQEAFLRRLLRDARRLGMAFVVWFASADPPFVQEPPLDLLQYIGLRRADGSPKPAWQVWAQEADRPLSPGRQP
jgi:hypothetical protein